MHIKITRVKVNTHTFKTNLKEKKDFKNAKNFQLEKDKNVYNEYHLHFID